MNRENILATISDLKEELSNIEAAKQQIESSLVGLRQLLKSPVVTLSKRATSNRLTEQKVTRTDFASSLPQTTDGGLLATDRVRIVLENIQGSFTRSELYKNASNDGNGAIAPGTFANIFSKLVKRGHVLCVTGALGQRDSVYMKADEANVQAESSPANQ